MFDSVLLHSEFAAIAVPERAFVGTRSSPCPQLLRCYSAIVTSGNPSQPQILNLNLRSLKLDPSHTFLTPAYAYRNTSPVPCAKLSKTLHILFLIPGPILRVSAAYLMALLIGTSVCPLHYAALQPASDHLCGPAVVIGSADPSSQAGILELRGCIISSRELPLTVVYVIPSSMMCDQAFVPRIKPDAPLSQRSPSN